MCEVLRVLEGGVLDGLVFKGVEGSCVKVQSKPGNCGITACLMIRVGFEPYINLKPEALNLKP